MGNSEDFYNNSSNGSIIEDGCKVKTMKFKLVMLIVAEGNDSPQKTEGSLMQDRNEGFES